MEAATVAIILASISAATAVAGTGIAVVAARDQANAAEDAADFNAAVASNNALAARQGAEFEADQVRRRNRLLLGKQNAAAAKSGVQLNSGSVSDAIEDSAVQGELDVLATLYSGAVTQNAFRSEASLQSAAAKNISAQKGMMAAGTILGGVSTATTNTAPFFK